MGKQGVFCCRGEPDELYIADNADPSQAVKVWRFNYNGWAASKNGYSGPFEFGATLEDGLLANFVTAAQLVAGTIKSQDDGKTFFLDLDNGILKMKANELSVSGKTVDEIAEAAASDAATEVVNAQTQEDIFNKLTNDGQLQGLYMKDGQLYVNASYLKSGTIDASLIKAGVITSADGTVKVDLSNNVIIVETSDDYESGRIELSANGIVGYGEDKTTGELIRTLNIRPGSKTSEGQGSLTSINSGASDFGISLTTIKPTSDISIHSAGSLNIQYKTVSWEYSEELGKYVLCGE